MRISSELRNRIYTTVHADSTGSSSAPKFRETEYVLARTEAEWRAILTPEAFAEIFGVDK